ncbi:unnamed protein product [Parnassius mnemosyne]|uniref:Brain-specific angiogenesis inhibitor 1-associated protein 2-like protein 1 n=1 Tax=Parnassius mnemosyne TaxID=213953 RepID=A0AAV1LQF2_9NEOP
METEELTKLVDGIYKNILDKFNPGARQMITAGKAYLKALHGAAAASRMYVDAVGKLGRQAQQGTWGGCADIGTALMKVVEVYREIQDQQMNILKAFYVDLLVPLETNLEKDTKVVQSEQKRFLQQHKLRSESYSKAAATIKKQRKKKTNATKVGSAMDKEMKSMQILEEEKTKLDAFCEQSLKNAMTQERRRYGFVLERQCSLAKHWLAYHTAGASAYNTGIDEWLEVSRTREFLPPNVEAMFVSKMRQVSFWADEDVYASPRYGDDDDRASVGSALRKTRSVDASCLDVRSIGELGSPAQGLSRAKSDFNLQASSHTDEQENDTRTNTRPTSLAPPTSTSRDPPLARALYAYAAAGENQLSFQQGDILALLGDRTKGWQYGENLRTHNAGWFPLAYTEPIPTEEPSPARWSCAQTPSEAPPPAPIAHAQVSSSVNTTHSHSHPPARMFGDTVTAHHVYKGRLGNNSPGLPPTLPAPSPGALSSSASATFHASSGNSSATNAIKSSTSAASFTTHAIIETRSFGPQTLPMRSQVTQSKAVPTKSAVATVGAVGNVSLHSSNDSGFSNEPPPQPDVDYSDEEAQRLRVPISKTQQNNERKTHLLKTQSLRRGPKPSNPNNGYLTDDQQLLLRNMLDMDKDSQKIKRTKSFWKFGRTTSEEIMEGMSLWQHRDIVDTVPEYKKKLFVKLKKELRPAPEVPEPRKSPNTEKIIPTENVQLRSQERTTIDRKDVKVTSGLRQAKSLGSIQTEERTDKLRKESKSNNQSQLINKKSNSEKSVIEVKHDEFNPRNESRHSDLTNTSTIKTNFENSFYNDENGDGFVMKTVKRREILQRYDNDSSSDVNSVVSSTDPYDCIIVDDHMTSKKQQELDRLRQARLDDDIKKNKENAYMPEFEEIEINPIKPHVRSTLTTEKSKKFSHERSSPKTMEFKTFKDNSKEIKSSSTSTETLKYKDNEQHTDIYGVSIERNDSEIRNDEPYNGYDDGTLKYKKSASKEEKTTQSNNFESGKKIKEYPQEETRLQKKENRTNENREPRIDYSLDRRQVRKDLNDSKNRETRLRSRSNRSYDDSTLPYNGRKEERYYEANISYFSDQERRVSRYDYETDSKKAEKSKIRQEEARLEARRYIDHRREGLYSESDDQKFNEALKQQRPQLLPRTKLLRRSVDGSGLPEEGHTFGPWYDLWGRETVMYK